MNNPSEEEINNFLRDLYNSSISIVNKDYDLRYLKERNKDEYILANLRQMFQVNVLQIEEYVIIRAKIQTIHFKTNFGYTSKLNNNFLKFADFRYSEDNQKYISYSIYYFLTREEYNAIKDPTKVVRSEIPEFHNKSKNNCCIS